MVDTSKIYISDGHVDSKGKLSIYNRGQLLEFLRDFFKQTSVEVVVKEKSLEFSDNMRNYYFAVVVKEVQKAYYSTGVFLSLKDIDEQLRSKFLYKEEYNYKKGVWEKKNHTLRKGETSVSKVMMRNFIDEVIMWSIKNLDWAIPYPREELSDDDFTDHQKLVHKKGNNYKNTF